MQNRKIAYISGGRMDFGLMLSTLKKIESSPDLTIKVYYTGLHLLKDFGNTYQDVMEKFPKATKIDETYKHDDRSSTAVFIGGFIKKLTKEFIKYKPDIVLTLGDRAEMLGTAITSLYLGIPSFHIHGGDKTGHVDEVVRHAITKLSHIHLVATIDAAVRIKKMGEDNFRIFTVGAPGIDKIIETKIMEKKALLKSLKLNNDSKYILLLQHPVFNENSSLHMQNIMQAVKKFELPVVVIYPNADHGGRDIIDIINKEKNNPRFKILLSVDRDRFLALQKYAEVWVTNSSAGIIESSSFHTPVVNVGTRQKSRLKPKNVINVNYSVKQINKAIIKSIKDVKYRSRLKQISNPWGNGKTGEKIVNIIKKIPLDSFLLNKQISY